MFVLINFIISRLLELSTGLNPENPDASVALWLIYVAAVFVPGIAVGVRRLHDSGHSGWWLLVPLANIMLLVREGTKGDNRYGPDPKAESHKTSPPPAPYGFNHPTFPQTQASASAGKSTHQQAPDDQNYESWIARLNLYLEQSGSRTRSEHFRVEALYYGWAHGMDPQTFVKDGYNKQLPDAEHERIHRLLLQEGSAIAVDDARVFDPEPEPMTTPELTESSAPDVADVELEADADVPTAIVPPAMQERDDHAAPLPTPDHEAELRALFALYKQGAISEEEFIRLRSPQGKG